MPDDLKFQSRTWMAERIAWGILAIVVAAALLGVFSNGILSSAHVADREGAVVIDYQHFAHKTAMSHFTVHVARAPGETVSVRLSRDFARFYDVESLYPQPLRSRGGAAGLELDFAPAAAGDLVIDLAARPKTFGLAAIAVDVGDASRLVFRQLVYP